MVKGGLTGPLEVPLRRARSTVADAQAEACLSPHRYLKRLTSLFRESKGRCPSLF